jgi:hypothetical protein
MSRRITLVNSSGSSHDWNVSREAQSRIVFAASFKVLRYALEDAIREFEQDIERVIIDRTATPSDFLEILAHLSEEFAGDLMYVRDDRSAYLSAPGRGGNRVLYALDERDVRFYLETHGLIAAPSVAAA